MAIYNTKNWFIDERYKPQNASIIADSVIRFHKKNKYWLSQNITNINVNKNKKWNKII